MSYSKTKSSVKRVIGLLEQMLLSNADISWRFDNPNTRAYSLRAGMHAATIHEEYKKYAHLKNKFVIKVEGNNVIAKLRVPEITPDDPRTSYPSIDDPWEALEILVTLNASKTLTIVVFPNLVIEYDVLKNWCNNTNYDYSVSENNGGTLISRKA